jgi:hypothetical protein
MCGCAGEFSSLATALSFDGSPLDVPLCELPAGSRDDLIARRDALSGASCDGDCGCVGGGSCCCCCSGSCRCVDCCRRDGDCVDCPSSSLSESLSLSPTSPRVPAPCASPTHSWLPPRLVSRVACGKSRQVFVCLFVCLFLFVC